MAETNFKCSGCRTAPPYNGFSKAITATGAAQSDTEKYFFHNQGNKRTAIWGVRWAVLGWEAATLEHTQIRFIFTAVEAQANRKHVSTMIHQQLITYRSTGDVVTQPSGQIWFTNPYFLKDGYLKITVEIPSDGAFPVWTVSSNFIISDATISDDMGDGASSTKLNKGWRRAKIIGQTRISPNKKQGYVR